MVVLSASSAFAVSDDVTLNEVDDEISVDDGVLAIEEDVNSLEEVSDGDILESVDETDDIGAGENIVTPENWKNFIDNETKIITYSGDELIFEGNFGADLNITAINVNSPIKLTGNNAVMTNISFYILSDDVVMTGFTLIEDKNDVSPIFAMDVENVEISNVKLNFTALDNHNGYAIWMSGVDNIKLLNNVINYVGTTVYNESNTNRKLGIFVEESTKALIKGNTFNISITSCHVDWPQIPAGSYNYVRTPYSEGIVIDDCDDLEFSGNSIVCTYNSRSGSDDTIYVVDVLNSGKSVISGNTINALGADHIYGIVVENVDNFTISGNDINVSSDVHQAIGIDVEGPATGTIKDNNIAATGTLVNTVYSGMNWKSATVTIENNNITAEGYAANAVELGGTSATVEGNTIVAKGNYTAAIISTIPEALIKNNVITAEGSNVGNATPGDYYMNKEVIGIKVVTGVTDIINNTIKTIGDYAIDLKNNKANITDNYLSSKKGVGDGAVINAGKANISGSSPDLKTILSAVDFYTVYLSGDVFYVTAKDENGDPIKNVTLFLTSGEGKVLNATTDKDGIATFFVDGWNVGDYSVNITFVGDKTYGPKQITSFISIEKRVSNIVAPASVNVLVTAIKNGYVYTLTLKDDRDNGLAKENVTITFNGKTETVSTDDLGVIKYTLVATKAGTQKLTITFDSNSNYVTSTLTATVQITKEASKLTAAKKTFKAKKKSKKYTVTLKDSKGKAISKVKVTIKVGKKTYKATTNAKGKATFNLKKLTKKGKYTAKITFAGNDNYNKATKSVKITVKK